MKLLYLCTDLLIKEYEQEFYGYTFTTKYNFILKRTYDSAEYQLIINRTGEDNDDFFGDTIDITAIMGKNGAGKSCLTDDIMQLICGIWESTRYFIAVFEEKQENNSILKCFYNVNAYVNSDIECFYCGTIEDENIKTYLTQVPVILRLAFSFDSGRWINSFPEYLGDLSTCALLGAQKETGGSTRRYFTNEIKKQIHFVNSNKWNEAEKFCHPRFLEIQTKMSSNKVKDELKNIFGQANKQIYNFYQHNLEFQKKFHMYLYIKSLIPEAKFDRNKLISIRPMDISEHLIKIIESMCKDHEELQEKIILFERYINYLERFWIKVEEREEGIEDGFYAFVKVDEINLKEFSRRFEEVSEDVFSYSWGLSSGEYQMFSMYARLFSVTKPIYRDKNLEYVIDRELIINNKNECEEDANVNHDIILILDEADVALHPEWQQQYIKSILQYLPDIFSGSNIQIILTTHSPIILSDIPNDHIIFMSNKDNKRVIERRTEPLTFGANIQMLYYDSFSLKKGSIGEYALDNINKLVRVLKPDTDKNLHNPKHPNQEEIQTRLKKEEIIVAKENLQKEIEKRIHVIGEPLIRRKLEDWLAVCFPQKKEIGDSYGFAQILYDLEQKPEELEKIKNKIRKKISDHN